MTLAFNHFLYLCSWAGGIFAIGLSFLLLAAIALAGWGWLTTPPTPAAAEPPAAVRVPFWRKVGATVAQGWRKRPVTLKDE